MLIFTHLQDMLSGHCKVLTKHIQRMGSNSTTCDSWCLCTEESCYQTCWCLSMTCCLDQSPRDAYTLRNPAEKADLPGWTSLLVLKQFKALFRLTSSSCFLVLKKHLLLLALKTVSYLNFFFYYLNIWGDFF